MMFIDISPIKIDSSQWIEPLLKAIHVAFGIKTRISPKNIVLEQAYDRVRMQYNSSAILKELISSPQGDTLKIIGITGVDLFIPILTFVFGEAQLGGAGSVVSSHRLHNTFYGLPEDSELTTTRLIKECIHELGHTFGLVHCQDQTCVMTSSTYVEDIDQKGVELCDDCRIQLIR